MISGDGLGMGNGPMSVWGRLGRPAGAMVAGIGECPSHFWKHRWISPLNTLWGATLSFLTIRCYSFRFHTQRSNNLISHNCDLPLARSVFHLSIKLSPDARSVGKLLYSDAWPAAHSWAYTSRRCWQVQYSRANPWAEFTTMAVNNLCSALLVSSLSSPQQFIFLHLKYMITKAATQFSAFLACVVKCGYALADHVLLTI